MKRLVSVVWGCASTMVLAPAILQAQTPRAPMVAYELTVDTTVHNAYTVAMHVRGVADTFQVALVKHPEYDDRSWRFVQELTVTAPDPSARITRLDSALWQVVAPGGNAVIRYRMVLPPLAQRPAHRPFLTPTGGQLGDLHSFMYVVGHTDVPVHLTLHLPADWQIATQLVGTSDPQTFFAPTADALMDAPILLGRLRQWRFENDHTPYRIVYWPLPNAAPFDTIAVVADVKRLTAATTDLFGGVPWPEYTFLIQDGAFGALEHENSVTIGAPSEWLARGHSEVMSTVAHEFFHAWNLVRIHPAEEHGIDYRGQPPVSSLWFGEGVTMYYANVLLRRAGIRTSEQTRIGHVEGLIARYRSSPGNSRFSAEQVSRVSNATVPNPLGDYDASTHLQGELLGTMLDLMIRDATHDRRSMDDVMRAMQRDFGGPRRFTDRDLERTIAAVCGCSVTPFFDSYIRGAHPIDFNRYLALAGLRETTSWEPARADEGVGAGQPAPDLRVRAWMPPGDSALALVISDPQTAWGRAGLRTGDTLVAMNDTPMQTVAVVRAFVGARAIGDTVRVDVLRAGRRYRALVRVTGYRQPVVHITEIPDATAGQREIRERWIAARP